MVKSINGIIGLAIGDAIGVPIEKKTREELIINPVTEMLVNSTYDLPKGTWSGSTSMVLATIDSINKTLTIDTRDLANKFVDWIKNANYTANNRVFNISTTIVQSLAVYEEGYTEPEKCGGDYESENENGSLMRMLPIAYYAYAKKLEVLDIYEIVRKTSSITYAHEISIMGCFIYVCYAIKLLEGKTKEEAYNYIKNIDYREYFSNSTFKKYSRIIKDNIYEYDLDNIKSTNYIIDTLEAVLWVIHNTESFNSSIIGAINLGDDTSAIGACTGGLAGIIYGIRTINIDWKVDLLKYDYIKEFCEKFDKTLNLIKRRY